MHCRLILASFLISAQENIVQSKSDIILRTFIGMVFIMVLMWLAVIVTGKIGAMRRNQSGEAPLPEEENQQDQTDSK